MNDQEIPSREEMRRLAENYFLLSDSERAIASKLLEKNQIMKEEWRRVIESNKKITQCEDDEPIPLSQEELEAVRTIFPERKYSNPRLAEQDIILTVLNLFTERGHLGVPLKNLERLFADIAKPSRRESALQLLEEINNELMGLDPPQFTIEVTKIPVYLFSQELTEWEIAKLIPIEKPST